MKSRVQKLSNVQVYKVRGRFNYEVVAWTNNAQPVYEVRLVKHVANQENTDYVVDSYKLLGSGAEAVADEAAAEAAARQVVSSLGRKTF